MPLRLQYKCAMCREQLHSAVLGCGISYEETKVTCPEGHGCNIRKHPPPPRAVILPRAPPAMFAARATSPSTRAARHPSLLVPDMFTARAAVAPSTKGVSLPRTSSARTGSRTSQAKPPPAVPLAGSSNSTTPKTRTVNPDGMKRGVKKGSKKIENKTSEDWFHACHTYRHLKTTQKQSEFLKSNESSQIFTGGRNEQQAFGRYLKKFDLGKLKAIKVMRHRKHKYEVVEKKLISYLDLHARSYKRDKCGVTWVLMRSKCLQFAADLPDQETYKDFTASSSWMASTLKAHGKIAMAESWATIEDRPEIINAEVEEAIESLEKGELEEAQEEENALGGDEEPECIVDIEEPAEESVPTLMEVQRCLDTIKRYCDAKGVPRFGQVESNKGDAAP
jgi:hypothetical protein